jgi:hypothetical protein
MINAERFLTQYFPNRQMLSKELNQNNITKERHTISKNHTAKMKSISIASSLLFFIISSVVSPAKSDNDVAVETSAIDLNYHVETFECDDDLRRLGEDDLQKKHMGMAYRICFEPNWVAREAGVGIKEVASWEWSMMHDVGEAFQKAVIDGQGFGGLSVVECEDGGKICAMDTMLTTDFYRNAGTVSGKGEVSFTAGTGVVPVEFSLFKHKFTIKFTDGNGTELNGEETAELFRKANEHNANAVVPDEITENMMAQNLESGVDVKEEL